VLRQIDSTAWQSSKSINKLSRTSGIGKSNTDTQSTFVNMFWKALT